MTRAMLVLGRDGMGNDATEADYDAWVSYVCERIDDATGLMVDVETRGPRDVQTDVISGVSDDERTIVEEAKASLWDDWCAAGAVQS